VTDPTVEILAVHDYGRQLANRDDVSAEERRGYERWRAEVLARAGESPEMADACS
jgi:hypothetical protein